MSRALKKPSRYANPSSPRTGGRDQRKNIVKFFTESPLVGSDIDFERDGDTGRDIDLRADCCSASGNVVGD